MNHGLIIDVIKAYRCGWCEFESKTERGVLLHQFAKHPHDLAAFLLARAHEFRTPPFKTEDILICGKTGLVVANCSCRYCRKGR